MLAYDPDLLTKNRYEHQIHHHLESRWENVAPIDQQGSHILTIQFLSSVKEVDNGITFLPFEKEYLLTWKNLSIHLAFNSKCSIDLNYSIEGFNYHAF
jgi:hypothetical protein